MRCIGSDVYNDITVPAPLSTLSTARIIYLFFQRSALS
jgi:hypothetical protein